ncbi:hypothetical protein FG379_000208 [Cryptosporidium bovis]|uniref:uncharacterized protein n=1 Tax=Cryptosporidium bovis TaxID=310047 RepID=UPI003519F0E5|nr:hypothetical protein FG379_000208 [Cryptosporidium bovis]
MGKLVRCETYLNCDILCEFESEEIKLSLSEQLTKISEKTNEFLTNYIKESSIENTDLTDENESPSDTDECVLGLDFIERKKKKITVRECTDSRSESKM